MSTFHVVIPARYGSSRFVGKPLALLNGEPMVAHTWRRGVESGAATVCVATDDARIADAVRSFGGEVCMTRADHRSGTDRLSEVVVARGLSTDAIVVNLQGDEPCMPPSLLGRVAAALDTHPEAAIATLATPIDDATEVFDPHVVKVVVDATGSALYFSRAPIPWMRDGFAQPGGRAQIPDGTYLRHMGLYAYRVDALRRLSEAPSTRLEEFEALEQLRALSLGLRIHVEIEAAAPPPGVDTPADLELAQAHLRDT